MEPRHFDALLIGGGVAAARCVRALRRGGFAGSIGLVGDEPMLPYNRPPLSKEALRDEIPAELLLAEPRSFYERRDVELMLGLRAVELDLAARRVALADGTRLSYRHCLLATGAEPRHLPFEPAGEVHYLRTAADAEGLRARARAGERATVVGGGFIGVEVAASLSSRGMEVTLFERASTLWAGALGARAGAWAAGRLAQMGVEVRLGTAAPPNHEPAPLVVAGIGVEPRTALAERAGLEVDDGIVVDERQRTSEPEVYAAGDAARRRATRRVEHWHAARESGERAAAAILGLPTPRDRAPWVFSEIGEWHLDVIGLAERWDEEVEVAPGLVAMMAADRPVQVAILEDAAPVEAVRTLLEEGGSARDLAALAAS